MDDTQLFIHVKHKNGKIAFDRLGKCLEDVKLWLCANRLKLNADKTDFIKRPARDACLCMGELQAPAAPAAPPAPPAPHFVFLITL